MGAASAKGANFLAPLICSRSTTGNQAFIASIPISGGLRRLLPLVRNLCTYRNKV